MRTNPITPDDLKGVFPVPPLARRNDIRRSMDIEQSALIADHMIDAGVTRFLYGGNAFLYHIALREYEQLLEWLASFPETAWVIPSAGPSYGRMLDQVPALRKHSFPCVMTLPCGDPRDPAGLEQGLREFSDAAGCPLMLYLKDENNFGPDKEAGLDVVGRLVDDGVCVAIKYAVVRANPAEDAYLAGLLQRVDRKYVISGIGERPAIVHMRDWSLPGFTTGSGCVAPSLSLDLFEACVRGDYVKAESIRSHFIPLEDLRDEWGPARVLHAAVHEAGIAETGPVPPFVSGVRSSQRDQIRPVARQLLDANRSGTAGRHRSVSQA